MTKHWSDDLPFGLPADFNFDVIHTKADVQRLLWTLPNRDRGVAARRLYERRDHIGPALAYAAFMTAWGHDDRELFEAFETPEAFAAALREVAPPVKRKRSLRVWRGIAVRDAHPGVAAIGLSWTRSREIACWFATRYQRRADLPGIRPFVFTTELEPWEIIAFNNSRGEQEVLVDLAALATLEQAEMITVDDTTITTIFLKDLTADDLTADSTPPADALADWRAAGERYEARKQIEESRKLLKAAKGRRRS